MQNINIRGSVCLSFTKFITLICLPMNTNILLLPQIKRLIHNVIKY